MQRPELGRMRFRYRARRQDGVLETGIVTARSFEDAKMILGRKSLILVDLKKQSLLDPRPYRTSQVLVVGFFRRLATMLQAGLPLAQSLDYLSCSESEPQLSMALDQVFQDVSAGERLSIALTRPRYKYLFDGVAIGLIRLGENTGALVDSLFRIAELGETQIRLKRAVTSALIYPAFLFLAIVAMGLFFVLVLAPGDAGLFASLGQELPWPTRVMIEVSRVLRSPILLGGAAFILTALLITFRWRFRRDAAFCLKVHQLMLKLPVLGSLVRKTVCAQMLYVISCALQVGMSTCDSLVLARGVCSNLEIRGHLEEAIGDFHDGDDLSASLERRGVFPHLVISMVGIGLEVGNLEIVLGKISTLYEEDVSSSLAAATRLAEPVLLAMAGAISAFLALATLLPIINLASAL